MGETDTITIDLSDVKKGLCLYIDSRRPKSLFELEDAAEHNEARFQIIEGCFYDYTFSEKEFFFLKDKQQIVQPHSRNKNTETLSPNIYVGTLSLPFYYSNKEVGTINLEIQSIKTGYRDDYRDMLELITEKCTDLLMQANSPVSQHFESDYSRDAQSLYQKFAFISSILGTDEFAESLHRIVTTPVTTWKEKDEQKDVRQVKRITNKNLKELIKGSNRSVLPLKNHLRSYGLDSLPGKISYLSKTDSVDTPENRFIKHALQVFLKFCNDINKASTPKTRLYEESYNLIQRLESHLQHKIFNQISRPSSLKINSPILQRKEGYREILRIWLMFDLAAKLIWKGGQDIYKGGKKDIAVLYEYWLFFTLLDLFQDIFFIEPKDISELIKETDNGLNLQIKQGKHTALKGVYETGLRRLNIRFNYNRSFSGKKMYPSSGSYTTTMRPDYTLSFWPFGVTEDYAEKQELIVHIHFDAKYKIGNLTEILNKDYQEADLNDEKIQNRNGIFNKADLLKMHAYKDAIRRTGGAYVLYPGTASVIRKGFHEIIPGLGAFPVRPSKLESGIGDLKAFIIEVIDHFINRASQREKMAYKIYDIHKNSKPGNLNAALPELIGKNRALIPDDIFVLVAYYKKQHLNWILHSGLYNTRANNSRGSLRLGPGEAGAKYLLLHSEKETVTKKLLKITESGPRVFSKQTLVNKGYPSLPSQEYYLVYKIEQIKDSEFLNYSWDITKLEGFKQGRGSALPFSVTLTQLMQAVVK